MTKKASESKTLFPRHRDKNIVNNVLIIYFCTKEKQRQGEEDEEEKPR